MEIIKLLGLSGSLRAKSYNTALLKATKSLAPYDIEISIFPDMGKIPLFNPDRENENIPSVMALKYAISHSHGIIIASPEYAHGISSVMKNALDWLVSGEEIPYIPVAILNTSPRARHAQAALREVLSTMSCSIIESASFTVPLLGTDMDCGGIIKHPTFCHSINDALSNFRDIIVDHT